MFSIKTDSRKVKNGDTFVALRGLSSDGHDYIEKAIQNGATTIVAEEGSYSVETKIVEDTTNGYCRSNRNKWENDYFLFTL